MDEKQYKKYKHEIQKYRQSLDKGKPNNKNKFIETRYNNSFKISIDVTKLINMYNTYLKKINKILTDVNIENENKLKKYKDINNNLSIKILDIQKELTINANKLQSGLKENKLSESDVTHYNNLINRIKKDTSTLKF